MQNLQASAAATLTAELLTLPICTVKTVYQTGSFTNPREAIRYIWQNYGLKGFYRASVPAVAAQIFSTASKYHFYRYLEDKDNNEKTHLRSIKNGIISGIGVSLVTHPLDVVRTLRQRGDKLRLQPSLLTLPYRGYSKTFGKTFIGSCLYFPLYDMFQHTMDYKHPSVSSFLTAVIATTIMQPLDYLKVRHISNLSLYDAGWQLQRYFKGLPLNLARVVPHFMIIMTATEYLKRHVFNE